MKVLLLNVATANEKWADEAVNLYAQKIAHFFPFEIKQLKSKKHSRESALAKKIEDSNILLGEILPGDFVVLFDEVGLKLDSLAFSKKIENVFNLSKKRLIFIIGGAYGVTEDLKNRADLQINLSPFTLNHLVAEVVALEQIYRAMTIIKKLPYHNGYY